MSIQGSQIVVITLALARVSQDKCHPQTIEVCRTRAEGLGLDVIIGDESSFTYDSDVFGVLVQQPATDGSIKDYRVCSRSLYFMLLRCFKSHSHCTAVLHAVKSPEMAVKLRLCRQLAGMQPAEALCPADDNANFKGPP